MPTKKPAKLTTEQKLKKQVRELKADLVVMTTLMRQESSQRLEQHKRANRAEEALNENSDKMDQVARAQNYSLQSEVERLTEIVRWQVNPETAEYRPEAQARGLYPPRMY